MQILITVRRGMPTRVHTRTASTKKWILVSGVRQLTINQLIIESGVERSLSFEAGYASAAKHCNGDFDCPSNDSGFQAGWKSFKRTHGFVPRASGGKNRAVCGHLIG